MTDTREIVEIERDKRNRDRIRRNVGVGETTFTFQLPMEGEAGTALTMFETDPLWFEGEILNQQARDGSLNPAVSYGFNLERANDNVLPRDILGLIGFCNITRFIRSSEGGFIGARAAIGVAHMGNITEPVPYKGFVTVSFMGRARMEPLDKPDTEYRRER